jgi:hypothetical protein
MPLVKLGLAVSKKMGPQSRDYERFARSFTIILSYAFSVVNNTAAHIVALHSTLSQMLSRRSIFLFLHVELDWLA